MRSIQAELKKRLWNDKICKRDLIHEDKFLRYHHPSVWKILPYDQIYQIVPKSTRVWRSLHKKWSSDIYNRIKSPNLCMAQEDKIPKISEWTIRQKKIVPILSSIYEIVPRVHQNWLSDIFNLLKSQKQFTVPSLPRLARYGLNSCSTRM
jgi:hypothetical protein